MSYVLLFVLLLIFVYLKISNNQFPISKQIQNSKFKIQNLFITGLLIISFVSIFFALNKWLALYKLGWLVLGAGLFWLIARAEYDRAKFAGCLLCGLAMQSLLAIWQFLAQSTFANKWLGLSWHGASELGASVIETVGSDGVGERWLRAYGGLDHPNVLGGILAISVLFIIGEYLKFSIFNFQFSNKFKIQNSKIIFWLFLIIFSAALFFSFSRAAWLALAAGLAVMLSGAVIKKNLAAQKNILQAVLISGLVFFILFFQFPNLVMTRLYGGERLEIKSGNERLESVKNSLNIIKKNWAIGAGIGNYTLALGRELPARESYFYQPAHNVYILIFSEIGIVGFILFICLIIYWLIFNIQYPISNKISNPKLEIRNWKLEIGESKGANYAMINFGVLAALVVLMSLDHWFWSLHF